MPTLSITISAAKATRLQEAWLKHFGVTPTTADIEAYLLNRLREVVYNIERRDAINAMPPPPPFDPG